MTWRKDRSTPAGRIFEYRHKRRRQWNKRAFHRIYPHIIISCEIPFSRVSSYILHDFQFVHITFLRIENFHWIYFPGFYFPRTFRLYLHCYFLARESLKKNKKLRGDEYFPDYFSLTHPNFFDVSLNEKDESIFFFFVHFRGWNGTLTFPSCTQHNRAIIRGELTHAAVVVSCGFLFFVSHFFNIFIIVRPRRRRINYIWINDLVNRKNHIKCILNSKTSLQILLGVN